MALLEILGEVLRKDHTLATKNRRSSKDWLQSLNAMSSSISYNIIERVRAEV